MGQPKIVLADDMAEEHQEDATPEVSEADLRRLDRFAPLLRDLMLWNLVRPTEAGDGFELRPDVEAWLIESSSRYTHSARPEIFVGRPCQRCGTIGVTKLVGDYRLCIACAEAPPVDEQAPATERGRHGRHDLRGWRARKAG